MKHIKQIYYTLTNKCPTSFRRIKNIHAFENIKDIFNKYLELVNQNLLDQISSPIHIRKGETTPFNREMSRMLTTYICSATFDLSEKKLIGPLFEAKFDFEWIKNHPHFVVEKHAGLGKEFTYPYPLISDAYLKFLELVNSDETCNTVVLYFKDKKLEKNIFTYAKEIKMSTNETKQNEVNNIFTPEQKEYIDNISVLMNTKFIGFQNAIQGLTHELERKSREFEDSMLALQQNYQSEISTIRQAIRNLTQEVTNLKSVHVTTDSGLPNDLGNPHIVNHGFSKQYPSSMEVFHKTDPRYMNANKNSENIIDVIAVTQNLLASLNHDFAMMTYIASVENTKLSSQETNTLSAKKAQICERLGALKACINKIENSQFINSDFFNQGVKNIILQTPLNPMSYKYSWHFGPIPQYTAAGFMNRATDNKAYGFSRE